MRVPDKLRHGETLAHLFERFNAVIDYLREIRLVAGDGIRLSQHINGVKIESTATGGVAAVSSGSKGYNGPFALSLENGVISCSGGKLNLNGSFYTVPVMTGIMPAEGYICLNQTIEAGGVLSPLIIRITQYPGTGDFPLGYCSVENDEPEITQYPVAMALIIITGPCPH